MTSNRVRRNLVSISKEHPKPTQQEVVDHVDNGIGDEELANLVGRVGVNYINPNAVDSNPTLYVYSTSDSSNEIKIDENALGTSTDGSNIVWTDDSTAAPNPYIIQPNTSPPGLTIGDPYNNNHNTIFTTGSGTLNITSNHTKYLVFDLVRKDLMPTSVFVSGRMVTLGVIGTDVECAYVGDQLIFSPGVLGGMAYQDRITVSIEYSDEICHFNVGSHGTLAIKDDSVVVDATLVSTIKK